MLILSFACVISGLWVRSARRQSIAVEHLTKLDSSVEYNRNPNDLWIPRSIRKLIGDDYFVSVSYVNFSLGLSSESLAEVVEHLRNLPSLEHLDIEFYASEISEHDLLPLRQLTQISVLALWTTDNSGPKGGLHQLSSMNHLRELQLYGESISNDIFHSVQELTSLKSLTVYGSSIDEKGLHQLAKCSLLEELYLGAIPRIEKALPKLASIKSLKLLSFSDMHLLEPIDQNSTDGTAQLDPNRPFVLAEDYDETVYQEGDAEDWKSLETWLRTMRPGLRVEVYHAGKRTL